MPDFSKYRTSTTTSGVDFSKYRTKKIPEDTIKQDVPDFSQFRTVSLPDHLGGGEYKTAGAGTLELTPRGYAGLPTKTGSERDHIISVALGGTSSRENLRYLATTSEGRQEGKVSVEQKSINDYVAGRISLPQARERIATKSQQILGLAPTEKEQTVLGNLGQGFLDIFRKPKESIENSTKRFNSVREWAKKVTEEERLTPEKIAEDKEAWKQYNQDAKEVVTAVGEALTSEEHKDIRKRGLEKGVYGTKAAFESTLAEGARRLGFNSLEDSLNEMSEKNRGKIREMGEMEKAMGTNVEDWDKFIDKIKDPEFIAEGFFQNLPNMLASMGIAAPAAVLGAPAAVTATILFGTAAALEGGFAYNEAIDFGATEEEARKAATLTGVANGMLESFPLFKLMRRSPVWKEIKGEILSNIVVRFLKQGTTEVVTESIQETVSNAAAQAYDENRGLFDNVAEAGYFGGLMGGGMSVTTDVAQTTVNAIKEGKAGLSLKDVSQDLTVEAKKFKTADEFVRKESFNPNSTIEYHISPDKTLSENKLFSEQKIKNEVGERGFAGKEENIGQIFTTKNPQQWSRQLNLEGNKKQQYVYLVEVKNPAKIDIMEGLPHQSINTPGDVKILKKIGGENALSNPSIMEEAKLSQLTDIWNKANVKPKADTKILKGIKTDIIKKLNNKLNSKSYIKSITKQEVKDVQTALIDVINSSELVANDKAKFIKTIKNTNTELKLQKQLPNFIERIEKLQDAEVIRNFKTDITKELKTSKIVKKNGKPTGKFTADAQAALDILRAADKMTKKQAQEKIIENLKKEPTPELALENYLLTLKIQSISADGYQNVLDMIKKIKETGSLTRELEKFNLSEKLNAERAYVEEKVRGGKKAEGGATFEKDKKSKFLTSLKSLGKHFILDWGGKMKVLDFNTSVNDESLSDRYDTIDQDNEYKRLERDFMNDFRDIITGSYDIKNTNISIHKKMVELGKTINIGKVKSADGVTGELKMTRDELIKRWMELQDPTLRESFIEGNKYTETIIRKIDEAMTTNDKKFANGQLDMYRDMYDSVNKIYSKIYGVNLPFNEFYSPIRRKGFKVDEQAYMGEFMNEVQNRTALTSSSFIGRVQNSNPIAPKGSIPALNEHFNQMNYFKAWVERVRHFNAIFRNPGVREAINDEFGGGFMKTIDSNLDALTKNGNKNSQQYQIVDWFRKSFTIGALALKPAVGVKQLVSTTAYMEVMNPVDFTAGVADFWNNPVENYKTLMKESVFIETRGGGNMERDISAAYKSPLMAKFNKWHSFMNTAMLNVKIGDKGAIIVGSWALRRKLMRQQGINTPTNEIIREYESFSSETQQSSDISKLSEVQMAGSMAKLFTMFKTSQRQYLQKETNAIRSLFQKDGFTPQNIKKVAKIIAIYHVMLPVIFQYIANLGGWDEEDKKDYLRAGLLGSFNGLFIFGDIIDSILREALGLNVWDVNIPLLTIGDDIRKVMRGLTADDISNEDVTKAIEGFMGVGNSSGLPTEQIYRMGLGISDIIEGNANDGMAQILGWSPYIVKGSDDKKKKTKAGSSKNLFGLDKTTSGTDLFDFKAKKSDDLFDF